MFTSRMFDRLSEWSSNLSVLSAASAIGPVFVGQSISSQSVILAVLASLACLWVSLRLSRLTERRE